MLTNKTIGFIGAGNMAEALIKGLISSKKVSAARIIASDRSGDRLLYIAENYDITIHNKNFEVAKAADIVFLAVKPDGLKSIIEDISGELTGDKLVISIAAGITIETITTWLRASGVKDALIVRAMPNTPAMVGEGAIGIVAARGTGKLELDLAEFLLTTVGRVVVFEDESELNAVTGLSGSGPAYVFYFMEAMAAAGIELGLSKEHAKELAIQTTLGAAKLAIDSEKGLPELTDMVTSPGGTTVEGLKILKNSDFCDIIMNAIKAATLRSEELSSVSD
ncbi:MAG: pyrroline-5-carboxylate reductase [Thermodesulfobacteriota bacterium]